MVDSNLLDKFKEITRYGVDQYLLSYSIFTSDNLNLIIGYYSGISEEGTFNFIEVLEQFG